MVLFHIFLTSRILLFLSTVNKHKPWIETSYHGVITENTDIVLLDPPLVALDKDAPIPYAGMIHFNLNGCQLEEDHSSRGEGGDNLHLMEAASGDTGVDPHREA